MAHLRRLAAVIALGVASTAALAQTYPAKPVRMVVPFPAGGATDIVARLVAQKMTEAFGQQVLIDNRAGAAGTIGSDAVAKAAPDGYTLLVGTSSTHAIAQSLYAKLAYESIRDFTPVAGLATSTITLSAHPSVPARTVKDLIALAKAKPDALSFASSGSGGVSHLVGEMFKSQAGVQMLHVPYKGDAPALADLVGGQVSLQFGTAVSFLPYIQSGKLKALAIATAQRHPRLPEVQTYAESAPGVVVYNWYGFLAPAGTPPEVTNRLAADIARVLVLPDVKEKFDAAFLDPMPPGSVEMARFLDGEVRQWKTVAAETGVSLD